MEQSLTHKGSCPVVKMAIYGHMACNGIILVRTRELPCRGSIADLLPGGGMPTSTNRTKWPIRGGAVAFQPGWFQGHVSAQIFINIGFGTTPANMSHAMLNGVELVGPSNEPYPGTWCFPQVPLPANTTVNPGDNATIQIIELARHGAALYNCADITFADPDTEEIPEVTPDNCFNSSQIKYNLVFTTESLTSGASTSMSLSHLSWMAATAIVFVVMCS
jgi:hypothetical protein